MAHLLSPGLMRGIIGTLSSGTDITERKRAEDARRAGDGRYRTLFEYAPDGIKSLPTT